MSYVLVCILIAALWAPWPLRGGSVRLIEIDRGVAIWSVHYTEPARLRRYVWFHWVW